ncbi:hypothetical protein FD755_021344 [Muntiacus reevesi]|uniref:AATF leucine zipper-containing domain-containing protein n=1 Tax=Muntiacus reevesi TaxID=9886 RepID=A0A5N3X1L6_MUNRE|nr:hypothetical protein FD755_021344 [Muntiacus reevesi]
MAGPQSLALQLEQLLNPRPREADPEAEPEEATAAKVIDRFDEGEDGEGDYQAVGSIRKLASASLLDTDKRYSGKTTSRKAWKEDQWEQPLSGSSDKEISDEDGSADGDSEDLGLEESDEEAMSAEDQEGGDEGDSSLAWKKKSGSHSRTSSGFSVQSISDFEKFTEGMDDLGSSEEEEDDEEESGMEEGEGEEDFEDVHEEDKAEDRASEDDGVVMTFSEAKVSEEVEKGRAVKNQIGFEEEISSDNEELIEEKQQPQRRGPTKRKLETEDYPSFMAKRFADFTVYRNRTLQKWHDKTKLASGKLGKGFGAFERSILTQIDHILMDKERLLRRTQTKRSVYRVLGKPEPAAQPVPESLPGQPEILPEAPANAHLKDLDEEIFDDDDFYHQYMEVRRKEHRKIILQFNDKAKENGCMFSVTSQLNWLHKVLSFICQGSKPELSVAFRSGTISHLAQLLLDLIPRDYFTKYEGCK